MKPFYSIALLFFLAYNTWAQKPSLIQLTEKDGLPDIEFYSIVEDALGFIWLAADKGLYRYDGKTFKNYNHPLKRGLSVFGLKLDKKGRVWCNNISGQIFLVEHDSLHIFIDLKDRVNSGLPSFSFGEDNSLMVSTDNGFYKIDPETKSVEVQLLKHKNFSFMRMTGEDHFDMLFLLNNSVVKFENEELKPLLKLGNPEVLNTIAISREIKNQLFIFSQIDFKAGCHRWDSVRNDFIPVKIPEALNNVRVLNLLEADDMAWLATDKGVFALEYRSNEFILKNHYLSEYFVTDLLRDQQQNYWFSTLRDGVMIMPNIYVQKFDLGKDFDNISSMDLAGDHLIMGTSKGSIGILDLPTKKFRHFKLDKEQKVYSLIYSPHYHAVAISQDVQSLIWDIEGRRIFNKNNLFINAKDLNLIGSNALLYSGFMMAQTFMGIFDDVSIKPVPLEIIPLPRNQLVKSKKIESFLLHEAKRAYTNHFSTKNNLRYIGFIDELRVFDSLNQKQVIRYHDKPIFAIDIAETDDGTIWVSTFSDGLFEIHNHKVVNNYTQLDGLLTNQISKLKNDGNNLWIITSIGLQFMDRKQNKFLSLTKQKGLDTYFITDIKIADSLVYLSSNMGLFLIDQSKAFKTLSAPEIYLSGVSIQEHDTILQTEYELPHTENGIKFTFNSNGFQSGKNINYKYRLIGLHNEWISTEAGVDFVRYPSLPAGDFIFEVKAMNSDGLESLTPASAKIRVTEPFWMKWWFYLILLGVLGVVIWVYYRERFKQFTKEKQILLEKAELDKELVISKIENLRSQMNPHFIFNALNSIQEYIVMNEKGLASSFLVKFSRLIRIYLEHSRKNEVPLEEELSALNLYLQLEKDRFEDALDYTIDLDPKINIQQTKLPPLLIQPYIENALKHGLLHIKTNRQLRVSFYWKEDPHTLICQIKDNGIGRKASMELNKSRSDHHQSFATEANQKRIKLLNTNRDRKISVVFNDLYSAEGMAMGTEVDLEIPQD